MKQRYRDEGEHHLVHALTRTQSDMVLPRRTKVKPMPHHTFRELEDTAHGKGYAKGGTARMHHEEMEEGRKYAKGGFKTQPVFPKPMRKGGTYRPKGKCK